MKGRPKVSVVVPAYNPGRLIVDAIESVFAQTFQDVEIIVVDDASTDDSQKLLHPFQARIRYIRQKRAGVSTARNRGALMSKGQFIAFLDADDLWFPTKLEKQVDYLERNPSCVLVHTDYNRSKSPNELVSSSPISKKDGLGETSLHSLLRRNLIHTSSVVVRKEALAESGLFDPKLSSGEDWDLWTRLAEVGDLGCIDEILSFYRVHDSQFVNSLKFTRNLVYLDQIMMARWSNDCKALQSIRAKTGRDYYKLGRWEWRHGNYARARAAFWQSAKFNERRLKSLVKAILCSFPAVTNKILHSLGK